jgi:SAM-dependent methyltransferase
MEPTDHNRRVWDEVHRPRTGEAAARLPEVVERRLPDLAGKHVLHLGCGTGEATAELAGLGALVTGVDASAEAVAAARDRAPAVAFVQGDVNQLPVELRRGRFDVVYTAVGTVVDAWAAGIAAALRPGGELIVHDEHPVLACLDDMLHWREDYFDGDTFGLGQVVTAVAAAGLAIESLEELPSERPLLPQARRVPGELLLVARKP